MLRSGFNVVDWIIIAETSTEEVSRHFYDGQKGAKARHPPFSLFFLKAMDKGQTNKDKSNKQIPMVGTAPSRPGSSIVMGARYILCLHEPI